MPTGVAWVDDSMVFSAAGAGGVDLYRQRLEAETFQPAGSPARLTSGGESAWLPSVAAGRLAFFSTRADANLWSVALDAANGAAHGPLRRMTRGPAPLGFLTVTNDFRTLAYFSYRLGKGDIPARSLNGHRAVSRRRTFGAEGLSGDLTKRTPADQTWRTLGDDCGGRPREWVDERRLIIERFARLSSIAIIDTETRDQRELLESADRSITNPRLSPDRCWIAFDASRPNEPASVCVAPFREQLIPESEWVVVDRSASHPIWSADGRLLYYTPTGH